MDRLLLGAALMAALGFGAVKTVALPLSAGTSWIDPATGHRIIRLGDEDGLVSPYFHQNAFTPSGNGVVLFDRQNLWLYDPQKGTKQALYHWDDPKKKFTGMVVAHHSSHFYYIADAAVWVVDLSTLKTKRIASIPREWADMSSLTVNADETTLAGVYTEGLDRIEATLPRIEWVKTVNQSSHPSLMFKIDIMTGTSNVIYRDSRWIDHPQFSPSDPSLLTLNLEMPTTEHQDTVFLLHSDGKDLHPVIKLTEHGEALIHSFFSPSGQEIWYDLQSPWGRKYFIGASRVDGKGDLRYSIDPSRWSYHYNLSHDEFLIAGDGNPYYDGGKWLYLYRRGANKTVQVEKLVSLAKHNYKLEPNVQFSPDNKWILFRGNFEGADHAYLVEVAKG